MPTNDSRFGLPKPVGADGVSQLRLSIGAVIDHLRDSGMVGARGVLADRPAAATAHAGKRFYVVSDQSNRVDIDIGTGWVTVGGIADGSVTSAKLDSESVTEPKYAPNSIPSAAFKNGTISAARLVAALKPSEGASGATEALRALGTAAGQAMPGNTSLVKRPSHTFTTGEDRALPAAGKKIGGFFAPAGSLVKVRRQVRTGSGSVVKLQRNGSDIAGADAISLGTGPGTDITLSQSVSEGDLIDLVVVTQGTGKGLVLSCYVEI